MKHVPMDLEQGLTNVEVSYIWKRLREKVGLSQPTQPKDWLDFIRSLPCVRCGTVPCEPHHFMGSAGPLKSSGIFTVPVCRMCHTFYHENGKQFNGFLLEHWVRIAHDWIKGEVA